jgi:integrase
MGRKPYKNLNLPLNMRARERANGKVYYFYDAGGKPRKEIPLGSDFILAIRKYAEMQINAPDPSEHILFSQVAKRYQTEEIPLKAKSTQSVQFSDMKHLLAFFSDPPAPLEAIQPANIGMFLKKLKDKPTTANRCKRLFSHIWNKAREWGYTSLPNPANGIRGHSLEKRDVYIDDALFRLVYQHATVPLQDAMDLVYLTGQRPGDALRLSEQNVQNGQLVIKQGKTKATLRIAIVGELKALLERIRARKTGLKVNSIYLLVNENGLKLSQPTLRHRFTLAKEEAKKAHPKEAERIDAFWIYDLRAKAADDMSEQKGDAAAADLLGHADVRTTKRHYLRRGKVVAPTR